ncbi:Endonuclease/exonuclease/phosphatase superfamily [Sesbania bispinosa]|nr:Endonuclease/exonuclease/phosphatase superfamily [Sesbania bispinosa]
MSSDRVSGSSPQTNDQEDELSTQEKDQLDRSTKKAKVGTREDSPETVVHETQPAKRVIPCTRVIQFQTATNMGLERKMVSYKDICIGVNGHNQSEEDTELFAAPDGHEKEGAEDDPHFVGDPLCPVVRLTDVERESIIIPWKRAIVVKVLGRKMTLKYFRARKDACPLLAAGESSKTEDIHVRDGVHQPQRETEPQAEEASFGPWMIAQRPQRRNSKNQNGISGKKGDNLEMENSKKVGVDIRNDKKVENAKMLSIGAHIKGAIPRNNKDIIDVDKIAISGDRSNHGKATEATTDPACFVGESLSRLGGPGKRQNFSMGLSLRSQVKFKNVKHVAHQGGNLADPSIALTSLIGDPVYTSPQGDVEVFNHRPPDGSRHGLQDSEYAMPDGPQGDVNNAKDLAQRYNIDLLAIFEPRVSGVKAERIIRKIGFPHHHAIHARGFSGGIWIIWREENFKVQIVHDHMQFVLLRILPTDGSIAWLLSFVYASPRPAEREVLWTSLGSISSEFNEELAIIGDFNSYASLDEKSGGAGVNLRNMHRFLDFLQSGGFMDLGYMGPPFIWEWHGVRECLDMGICTAVNELPIAHFSSNGILWNLNEVDHLLPDHIRQEILGVPPPAPNLGRDTVCWASTSNGDFTTRSAYDLVCELSMPSTSCNVWKALWALKIPQRVKSFMWLVLKAKLMSTF